MGTRARISRSAGAMHIDVRVMLVLPGARGSTQCYFRVCDGVADVECLRGVPVTN